MENLETACPFVSIIVPHKESIVTLKRLLDTIPASPQFEVIVVDDRSGPIVETQLREMQTASNVKIVFAGEIGGNAGKARNIGLSKAGGAWIIFADADDYFTPKISRVIEIAQSMSGADIIYFDVDSVDQNGLRSYRHVPYSKLVRDHSGKPGGESDLRYMHSPPWGKLVSRRLVLENDLKFDEVPASNDVMFSIAAGHLALNICTVQEVIYIVTQTVGSITNTVSSVNLISKFDVALRANKFLRDRGASKYQHSILYFIFRAATISPRLAFEMVVKSIVARNNPFIGISKAFSSLKLIRQRESR